MMNERGVGLAHTTILRWVQHYTPEFEKRWKRYARTIGGSWRMDETYVKVDGRWCYLYRAIDADGNLVDSLLSETRDMDAAKRFFARARTVVLLGDTFHDRRSEDRLAPERVRTVANASSSRCRSRRRSDVSVAAAASSG